MAPVTVQPPAERSAWDEIVEKAKTGSEVIVTNDDVVVISTESYTQLKKDAALTRVREEWDRRLACLNEPGAAEKLRKIFHSTPEEIAAAANAAALANKR